MSACGVDGHLTTDQSQSVNTITTMCVTLNAIMLRAFIRISFSFASETGNEFALRESGTERAIPGGPTWLSLDDMD